MESSENNDSSNRLYSELVETLNLSALDSEEAEEDVSGAKEDVPCSNWADGTCPEAGTTTSEYFTGRDTQGVVTPPSSQEAGHDGEGKDPPAVARSSPERQLGETCEAISPVVDPTAVYSDEGVASKSQSVLSKEEQNGEPSSNDQLLTPESSRYSSGRQSMRKDDYDNITSEDMASEEDRADDTAGVDRDQDRPPKATSPSAQEDHKSDMEGSGEVGKRTPSKSLSPLQREEQKGDKTPPLTCSCEESHPVEVDTDVNKETPSKSLSPSQRDEKKGDGTPPLTCSCEEVDTDVNKETPSKSLSPSQQEEKKGGGTPPLACSCQESHPVEVDTDVKKETPSKSLSPSQQEKKGDGTPPLTCSCEESHPVEVDTDVKKETPSKSSSPSQQEKKGDGTPPLTCSCEEVDTDFNKETPSKSLSPSQREEKKGDGTPPLTCSCEESHPVEVDTDVNKETPSKSLSPSPHETPLTCSCHPLDEEKLSKSLSPSQREEKKGDGTPPLTCSCEEVDTDVKKETPSKSLSPSQQDKKGDGTPPLTCSCEESHPVEVDTDVNKETPSKSLSPSQREEKKGDGTPPLTCSCEEVDTDVNKETPSKSLSPSQQEKKKSDGTSPLTCSCEESHPVEVDTHVNKETPSKSLSPSQQEQKKGDGTPPLACSCQESHPVEVDTDVNKERPSKSLSPSQQEKKGDGTPPLTCSCEEVDTDVNKETPSKSLSPSQQEKKKSDGKSHLICSCEESHPVEVDTDVNKETPSKSLSPSQQEKKGDGTPPLTCSCEESHPVEVDTDVKKETPSKSLSPSQREEKKGDGTPPLTCSCEESHPLEVDTNLNKDTPSKSLSPSQQEKKGDGTPPLTCSCEEVDTDVNKETPSKSLIPSKSLRPSQEEQQIEEQPSPITGSSSPAKVDTDLHKETHPKSLNLETSNPSLQEGQTSGLSPPLGSTSQGSGFAQVTSDQPLKSLSPVPLQGQEVQGTPHQTSSSQESEAVEAGNDNNQDKEKPSKSLSTSPRDGQTTGEAPPLDSKTSTQSSPHEDQTEVSEKAYKESTPEPVRGETGSPDFAPALVCLEDDIRAAIQTASTSIYEGIVHHVEDMASKPWRTSPSENQYSKVIPDFASKSLKTFPREESFFAEGLVSVPGFSQEIKHTFKVASKSLSSLPQEEKVMVPDLLERYFSDAIKTCSRTLFHALKSQVEDYDAEDVASKDFIPVKKRHRKVRRAQDIEKDFAQAESLAGTLKVASSPEATGDNVLDVRLDEGRASATEDVLLQKHSPGTLSGHQQFPADVLEEHPENVTETSPSAPNNSEDLKGVVKRHKQKIHPVGSEEEDAPKHPCPHSLFAVLEDTKTKENIETSKHFQSISSKAPERNKKTHKVKISKDCHHLKKKKVLHISKPESSDVSLQDSESGEYMQKVKKFFRRMQRCRVCPAVCKGGKMDVSARPQKHQTKKSFLNTLWKKLWTG
uniref:serine/arginine repetitive matrix protein 2-like isoform X2 n=1 Tax=Doryrhamphus excisus TaxID=161450 RepID=UPI0025ADA495|nr:serine/arginine repetitive matrix protein 2-like isoform X2 [Doryrhamphus excisus]